MSPRADAASERSTAYLALWFAVVFAVFMIGPAFMKQLFGPYPLLRWGDILDLFTPLVVLPLAWLLFRHAGRLLPTMTTSVLFAALAGLWASAQGMHLAANAIGHLIAEDAGDAARLTHDLDEVISHYLWHAALLGLSALIVWRSLRGLSEADRQPVTLGLAATSAAIFGLTFFLIVVEGATAPLGLPGAAIIAGLGLALGRARLAERPTALLFVVGYALSLVLCFVWAGLHDWQLVEFSKAGLIE